MILIIINLIFVFERLAQFYFNIFTLILFLFLSNKIMLCLTLDSRISILIFILIFIQTNFSMYVCIQLNPLLGERASGFIGDLSIGSHRSDEQLFYREVELSNPNSAVGSLELKLSVKNGKISYFCYIFPILRIV